ncbi:MAG: tubulin/FtsZ family protein [Candidatus Geothermarchaeales archaeon]
MRLAVLGIGQAGGRVADLFHRRNFLLDKNVIPINLAVNTAKSDLMGLTSIPMKNRILIGQTRVKGHGVGCDNHKGAEIAEEEKYKINSAIADNGTYNVDAFLVIAGLGGGTGSGAAPVIAEELRENYDEPVYALGILPSDDEGAVMARNATRSLLALRKSTDGIIIFDNQRWKKPGYPILDNYQHMNRLIWKPFPYLLGAGEVDNIQNVGGKVVDASDIINTIEGLSVIGCAQKKNPFLRRAKKRLQFYRRQTPIDQLDNVTDCYTIIKDAVAGRLTAECDIRKTRKALMLIAGPPDWLNSNGIIEAKNWLEDQVDGAEVRGGDYAIPYSDHITGIVLFSGLPEITRQREISIKAKKLKQ